MATTRRPILRALGLILAILLVAACESQQAPATLSGSTAAPAPAAQATAAPATAAPATAAPAATMQFPGPSGRPPVQIPILGAIPNAPTRVPVPSPTGPTPTPAPAATPPPAKIVQLYAHVDTVASGFAESPYNVDANLGCVKTSLFARGQRIVWRMEVVDTTSGKVLQAADMKAAILKLPTGQDVSFRYGRHGSVEPGISWFWVATWDVPLSHPLGTLDYRINLETVSGKSLTLGENLAMIQPERDGGRDTRVRIVN